MESTTSNLSGAHLPPSALRIQPLAWAAMSALCGGAAFSASMLLLWHDLPGLAAPSGTLGAHASYLAMSAAHSLWPSAFAAQAAEWSGYLRGLVARGELWPLGWRAAISAAAAVIPAIPLAGSYLKPRDGLLRVRGGQRFTGAEAVKRLNEKLAEQVARRPDQFISPQVQYPADMWTRHVLVVGGVGAGKSRLVMPLIERIIDRDEKLIAFDPKGEPTSAFQAPVLISPWDKRSYAWDIAKDLRNLGDIRGFAQAVIPDDPQPFWVNASRQFLVGYLLYLKDTRGTLWGWQDLAGMLLTPIKSLLPLMDRYNPEAARAAATPGVTTQGILINLAAHCSALFDLAKAWGSTPAHRRISFAEWTLAEPRHRQIFIQGHGSYPQLTQALTQGILGVVAGLVSSPELPDSFDRKLWIVADEFAQMGKVPLRKICEVGRSKGARVVMATQDFAQLEEIHGKHSVQALISMCGTLVVGQVGPGDTAETLCKALGSREVERRSVSESTPARGAEAGSTTVSFAREDLALYKPSELATRLGVNREGNGVVMALATGGDVYELTWPITKWKQARKPYEPAAWITGAIASPALNPLAAISKPIAPPIDPAAAAHAQATADAFAGLSPIEPQQAPIATDGGEEPQLARSSGERFRL